MPYATRIEFDCVDLGEVVRELLPVLLDAHDVTVTPCGPGGGNPCVVARWAARDDAEIARARRSAALVRAWLASRWMSWLEDDDGDCDGTHDYAGGLEGHDHEFTEGDSCPGCEALADPPNPGDRCPRCGAALQVTARVSVCWACASPSLAAR
jgi:hypothetical protein